MIVATLLVPVADRPTLGSVLPGLITTFFALALPDLVPEWARAWRARREFGKFRAFFGAPAVRAPVLLVFSKRTLDPRLSTDPFLYPHDSGVKNMAAPREIESWLAAEDVQAAMDVASLFNRHSRHFCRVVFDRAGNEERERCRVSFGLQVNGLTMDLGIQSGLFGVSDTPLGSPARYRIKIAPRQGDGPPEAVEPSRTGNAVAIIARVVNPTDPGRISFVCAGEAAEGTLAAGRFLSTRWRELHELYEENRRELDRESMAVIIEFNPARPLGAPLPDTAVISQEQGRKRVVFSRSATR